MVDSIYSCLLHPPPLVDFAQDRKVLGVFLSILHPSPICQESESQRFSLFPLFLTFPPLLVSTNTQKQAKKSTTLSIVLQSKKAFLHAISQIHTLRLSSHTPQNQTASHFALAVLLAKLLANASYLILENKYPPP